MGEALPLWLTVAEIHVVDHHCRSVRRVQGGGPVMRSARYQALLRRTAPVIE